MLLNQSHSRVWSSTAAAKLLRLLRLLEPGLLRLLEQLLQVCELLLLQKLLLQVKLLLLKLLLRLLLHRLLRGHPLLLGLLHGAAQTKLLLAEQGGVWHHALLRHAKWLRTT